MAIQLLSAESGAISGKIQAGLKALGSLLQVEAVYLTLSPENQDHNSINYSWQIPDTPEINFNQILEDFKPKLTSEKPFYFPSAANPPNRINCNYPLQSFLAVPLEPGILSFYCFHYAYPWENDRVMALTQAGEIFAKALQRQSKLTSPLKSDRNHQALLQIIPDLLFCISKDGIYRDYRLPSPEHDFIRTQRIGKHLLDVLPSHVAQRQLKYIEQVLQTGETACFEQRLCMNGICHNQEVRITPSSPDEVLLLIRDITERKSMEKALEDSENRAALAFRGNNDGIWDWNVQTDEVFFSPRWKEMLGYRDSELPNHLSTWSDRVHPDDLELAVKAIQDHFDQKTPFYCTEHRLRCKDGSYKWILDRGRATWDDNGKVIRMVGSHTDISDRKAAEAALQESEERWQLALKGANDGIWDWNLASDTLFFSTHLLEMLGYADGEWGDRFESWRDRIHPEDLERVLRTLNRHFDQETPFFVLEYRLRCKNGSYKWILDRGRATWNDQGEVTRMVGSHTDISDRKRAETQLQQANRGFKTLSHCNQAIVRAKNETDLLQSICDILIQTCGYRLAWIGYLDGDRIEPMAKAGYDEGYVETLHLNLRDEIHNQGPIGQAVRLQQYVICPDIANDPHFQPWQKAARQRDYASAIALPLLYENGVFGVLVLYSTETNTFQAEEVKLLQELTADFAYGINTLRDRRSLAESEEMLRHAKNDMEQRVQQRTLELGQINEKLQQELRDRIIIETKLRKSEKQYRTLVQNFPDGAVFLFDREGRHTIADGVGLTSQNLCREQLENHLFTAVLPEKLLIALRPLYQAALNGETLTQAIEYGDRIYAYQALPVRNEQARIFAGMIVMQDITERATIERMKDEFIAVVSHELRTPLTSIHGALNLLDTGLVQPDSPQGSRVIHIAAESAARLTRLVNDILELERLESGKIKLNPEIIQALPLLQQSLDQMQVMANRAGITLTLAATDCQFVADRDRILQVLTNLLSNAIKFSDRNQTVSLHLQPTSDHLIFIIQDQGRGIHPSKLDCIFERFHQIDASDSRQKGGTGLGLAICRSIVEQHGGQIWVESTLNQGSCFYFSLRKQLPITNY
ncbi:MAG: PAS domain-containing protein [Jaaginema sp. PMC 1079.18]|nr:PAS domain-containing protein [Jaaginema sp. PMC 1080.18]MEC4851790.1 PAS domain-containing protein [Jaaginema sp. PMC 1079.18]